MGNKFTHVNECMTICNDSHEEIVFDSRDCPLCEAIFALDNERDEIENLREEIQDLQEEIEELKANV